MVQCKKAAKEVSFEWSHYTIVPKNWAKCLNVNNKSIHAFLPPPPTKKIFKNI